MALYKRYLPPKPGVTSVAQAPQAPPAPPPKPAPRPVQHEEPPKRKRERTDEEVAERKAKKLRKKGIDPATVERPAESAPQTPDSSTLASLAQDHVREPDEATVTEPAASGDFSHVKDKKKRHKLEKEARKARIAAEKQAKADGKEEQSHGESPQAGDVGKAAAQQQSQEVSEDAGAAQDPSGAEEVVEERKKRKKRRKEKERKDTEIEAEAGSQHLDGTNGGVNANGEDESSMTIEPEVEAPNEQRDEGSSVKPKKRRHKLEKVLEGQGGEAEAEDDTEHLKKHGGIIGKLQKSQKRSEDVASVQDGDEERTPAQQPILRDLVPLPQPEKAPTPEFRPDPNALPAWLAKPTVIPDDQKSTFAEMGLDARLVQHVSNLGFTDALPVQQALIPLLLPPGTQGSRYLPGAERALPDMAVDASTGSGKTIAYLLPILEALKKQAGSGKLKALVVVPTRELVLQVAAVAESLTKGSSLKVGVATGTGSFGDEQARLMHKGRRHDPGAYRNSMAKAHRLNYPSGEHSGNGEGTTGDDHTFDDYLDELDDTNPKDEQLINDTVAQIRDYVPTYESTVDMLIATPGRLLEHFDNTFGFSIAHIEWLILDEADKLLDGQYSNFLDRVMSELARPHAEDQQDTRERFLRSTGRWEEDVERRVRKVVLSATMTRDVSKLVDLRLRHPQMLVVRGTSQAVEHDEYTVVADGDVSFELPPTLREFSVHVGDGSEKPLFLLQILKEHIMPGASVLEASTKRKAKPKAEEVDESDSSDSESSSELSDSGSDVSSTSDSSDASEQADSSNTATELDPPSLDTTHSSRAAMLEQLSTAPTILIFTSSTESATRLSHLLSTLQPNWTPNLTLLTSTTASKTTTKHILSLPPTSPLLAITTDRAARGLDALGSRTVTHVVQYDVPRSATNYVHRVGRTARAGRGGEAWTLFTHHEAKWFINEVVRNRGVRRGWEVERVKVVVGEEAREGFAGAVAEMREVVFAGGGKGMKNRK